MNKKDTKIDETVNNLEEIFKNTKESEAKKIDTLKNNQTEWWKLNSNEILKYSRKHCILNINRQKQTEKRILIMNNKVRTTIDSDTYKENK